MYLALYLLSHSMSLVKERHGCFSLLVPKHAEFDHVTAVARVGITCCGVLGSVTVGIAPGGCVKGQSAVSGGCEHRQFVYVIMIWDMLMV